MTTSNAVLASVESVVRMYAAKYIKAAGGDLGLDDLMQVGRMAALKAAPKFDPAGGATFATFCRMPVETAIKHEVARKNPRLSLDAQVGEEGESFLSLRASDDAGAELGMVAGERDAKIRALVARVMSEFKAHEEMAAMLVERLVDGAMVDQRFRSEVSLADIAAKFGCSRQNVGNLESKLKARLAVELAQVWS